MRGSSNRFAVRNWLLIAFAAFGWLGCSSSTSSGGAGNSPPSLYNTWIYTAANGVNGAGLTLKSDGTYENQALELTSSTSGNDQVEIGTFVISGASITFTPKKWSCPEPSDPPYTVSFEQSGNSLTISYSSGVIVFSIDTSPAATNFSLSTGCFSQSGTFTPSPIVDVGSCAAPGASCVAAGSACCAGSTCVTANGGTCAANCTSNSQCSSGCCVPLSNSSQMVCARCADAGL